MNTRLSVSTIAYLAEQERRDEEEKLRHEREEFEQEAAQKHQAELNRAKSTLPFSEPLAIEICERVSSGELLIDICADEHLPTVRRTLQWIKESPEFAALYRDSISDRLTIFEEEVIKIADDAARDFRDVVRNGRTQRVLDGDAIARAKLRVEVRFRHLKAFKPSLWGEQSTLNLKQSDPTDIDNMTSEALARKISELETKDRIVNSDRGAKAAWGWRN
jgi:hypothetical protein